MDYRHLLLYTREQEQRFRAQYPQHPQMLRKYEDWFYTFPLYEWHEIALPPKQAPFIIGMLCLLMREGRVQFSIKFPDELPGSALIQREARNDKEFQEYWDEHIKKHQKSTF